MTERKAPKSIKENPQIEYLAFRHAKLNNRTTLTKEDWIWANSEYTQKTSKEWISPFELIPENITILSRDCKCHKGHRLYKGEKVFKDGQKFICPVCGSEIKV